jgi:hypothetical protein
MWVVNLVTAQEANGSLLVAVGLAGIVIVAVRLARDRPGPIETDSMQRIEYATWRVPPDLLGELHRYRHRLSLATGLACSLAFLLEGVALVAATHLGLVDLRASRVLPAAWLALVVLAAVAGAGVGYPVAVRVSRARGPVGPRYADLRERRLADYRTPALRWAGLAIVALPAAAAVPLALAGGTLSPLLLPAALFLLLLVAEALLAMTARVPRMVVSADPALARRCDDLLRAQVITSIQTNAFVVVAAGGLAQFVLVGRPASWVTLAGVALAGLMALFTVANDCRLGGRVNGWPGKPLPG